MADMWFHVMHEGRHVAVFRMKPNGARELFLPSEKSLATLARYVAVAPYVAHWFGEEIGPEAFELCSLATPYMEVWFSRYVGRSLRDQANNVIEPGDERYPRALAVSFAREIVDERGSKLSRIAFLSLWAFTTPVTLTVTLRQLAQAMSQEPTSNLRESMEASGLRFTFQEGDAGYTTSIEMITKVLGGQVADKINLYSRQVADFLGVGAWSSADILRSKGIAIERTDGVTIVPWGALRRLKRTGIRKFEIVENGVPTADAPEKAPEKVSVTEPEPET